MAPVSDLQEELHHQASLPGSRVTHQFDVLSFGPLRYPHELLELDGLEADAISLDGVIEVLRRHQHRAFEQATVLHFFQPLDILPRSEDKQSEE